MAKTIHISGPHDIRLVLDEADPYTPAMVCGTFRGRKYSSTYDCAMDNGIEGMFDLTPAQYRELDKHRGAVDAAYDKARADHPDYR